MKEYIERAFAVQELEVLRQEYEMHDDCDELVARRCRDALSAVPAADVAEVRHGRWIPKINHTYIPVEYDENGIPVLHEYISYRCSLCGREETKEEPYCHCGARMDKEDDKQ